jgi:hypothetical protein
VPHIENWNHYEVEPWAASTNAKPLTGVTREGLRIIPSDY